MVTGCPAADGSSPRQTKFDSPMPMCIDPLREYQADILTSLGTMSVYLHPKSAPRTVNNFVCLSRYHYYDGLTFHRVIKGFVVQGGCPQGSGRGGPGYKFEDELPAPGRYEVGSLAMANAGPNTNGSQFFVVTGAGGAKLEPNYSLFGKVIQGLEVAEAIQNVDTDRADKPVTPVVIESITVRES